MIREQRNELEQLDGNDKSYYHKRDGSLYTTYTKDEIDSLINLEDFSTWYPFLKDMDYPAVPRVYQSHKNFHKYVAIMRLVGYRNYGWADKFESDMETKAYLSFQRERPEKIILTRRDDGDWDCMTEHIGYCDGKYLPVRITGVIDGSNIPALLEFKLNEGCLYKMEVMNKDDIK